MLFIRKSRPDSRIVRWTGFTLTELMIVVSVVGLLAALAMPAFAKAREGYKLGMSYRNLREIDSAKQLGAYERSKANGAEVIGVSDLGHYLTGETIIDVLRESYIPDPIGTPPEEMLLSEIGPGLYTPDELIPAH